MKAPFNNDESKFPMLWSIAKYVNSLPPDNAMIHRWFCQYWFKKLAYCLVAPSHYLNTDIPSNTFQCICYRSSLATHHRTHLKIIFLKWSLFPKDQWVTAHIVASQFISEPTHTEHHPSSHGPWISFTQYVIHVVLDYMVPIPLCSVGITCCSELSIFHSHLYAQS